LSPLRELQLVEAYRQGGQAANDALRELVNSYQRRIYSVCYRMVRHRDDASDLTQDVLIKLIESLDTYNGQSKLSTWVIRVAMNACLSHLRRQKIRNTQSIDMSSRGPSTQDQASTRSGGIRNISASGELAMGGRSDPRRLGGAGGGELLPEQSVEQAQRLAMVADALHDLDPETRALLVLRDVQDLDYQHLADVLEIPLGTVKSRLFRAREALRIAIEARSRGEKL
jgi:RNA polymerase sigma-70 factor, ECF subfamily